MHGAVLKGFTADLEALTPSDCSGLLVPYDYIIDLYDDQDEPDADTLDVRFSDVAGCSRRSMYACAHLFEMCVAARTSELLDRIASEGYELERLERPLDELLTRPASPALVMLRGALYAIADLEHDEPSIFGDSEEIPWGELTEDERATVRAIAADRLCRCPLCLKLRPLHAEDLSWLHGASHQDLEVAFDAARARLGDASDALRAWLLRLVARTPSASHAGTLLRWLEEHLPTGRRAEAAARMAAARGAVERIGTFEAGTAADAALARVADASLARVAISHLRGQSSHRDEDRDALAGLLAKALPHVSITECAPFAKLCPRAVCARLPEALAAWDGLGPYHQDRITEMLCALHAGASEEERRAASEIALRFVLRDGNAKGAEEAIRRLMYGLGAPWTAEYASVIRTVACELARRWPEDALRRLADPRLAPTPEDLIDPLCREVRAELEADPGHVSIHTVSNALRWAACNAVAHPAHAGVRDVLLAALHVRVADEASMARTRASTLEALGAHATPVIAEYRARFGEPPRLAQPVPEYVMARDESLQRAVLERPDDDAPREAYGAWLRDRGDPRGQFIDVQLRLARGVRRPSERKALRQLAKKLMDECSDAWTPELFDGGMPRVETDYTRGFVDFLCTSIEGMMRGLPPLAAIEPVRELSIEGEEDDRELAERLPSLSPVATLRELHLHQKTAFADGPEHVRRVATLLAAPLFSTIEALKLHGGEDLDLTDVELRAWLEAPWPPHLRSLDLWGARFDREHLKVALASPQLSRLEHLGLRAVWPANWPEPLDCAGAICASPHLELLRSLDLSETLDDEEARALAQRAPFRRLERLALEECWIGADGARAILSSPWLHGLRALALRVEGDCDPDEIVALLDDERFARLESLSLDLSAMSESAARALARSSACRSLRSLSLAGATRLEPVEALARTEGLPSLTHLFVNVAAPDHDDAERIVLDSPLGARLRSLRFEVWEL